MRKVNLETHRSGNERHPISETSGPIKQEAELRVEEQGGLGFAQELPCRIVVNIRGLEWFVYNRSPAYDSVLAALLKSEEVDGQLHGNDGEEKFKNGSHEVHGSGGVQSYRSKSPASAGQYASFDEKHERSRIPTTPTSLNAEDQDSTTLQATDLAVPTFLNMLPIGIECGKGAMAMGNEHTRCILVVKFNSANGRIDASSSSPQDRFKQEFVFDFEQPVVQLKPNNDFKESQQSAGSKAAMDNRANSGRKGDKSWILRLKRYQKQTLHEIQHSLPFLGRSVEYFVGLSSPNDDQRTFSNVQQRAIDQSRWLGLSRYLDDDADDGHVEQERWKAIEYGQVETIIDCKSIGMSFFWDVPGPVLPVAKEGWDDFYRGHEKDVNGSQPPEWGLNLRVGGGVVNYGPWADRQRVDLQTVFFPSSFAHASTARPLKPGQLRVSTKFKILITFDDQVVLRVYTREESKDWRWKSHLVKVADAERYQRKRSQAKGKQGQKPSLSSDIRPAGWLELTVSADSCVTYLMDMVASENGYSNILDLDLKAPYMSSSANHELMWRSKCLTMSCDLSYPRGWNLLREWRFDVASDELKLFILRDHAFLLTDLVNDWTTSPPGAFLAFVPFIYHLGLRLPGFKVYLNTNDSNIIDKPSTLDDNAFLVIFGEMLVANVRIPLQNYRPLENRLTFDVDASQVGLKLLTPIWNTQNTFLKDKNVAKLEDLSVQGFYDYFTATSPSLTDTLSLDLHGRALSMHVYGFLIRYFMTFKDNYFGEDLHFQTLEEHQQRASSSSNGKSKEDSHSLKVMNDLDVMLAVMVDDVSLIIPAHLYSATDNIKVDVSSVTLDLRFTNYYMDIGVSTSPLALTQGLIDENLAKSIDSNTQAFIDGLTVTGHRLFGLPPSEPTYVCNWDFGIGEIAGECSLEFLATFVSCIKVLAFQFKDAENALPRQDPLVIHDATFLRAQLQPVMLWLHVNGSAFLVSTSAIKVDFNDWSDRVFSERLHLVIPQLVLASVDPPSPSRARSKGKHGMTTYAYIQTAVDLMMLESKRDSEQQRQLQQEHLHVHDSRTGRTPWLIDDHRQQGPFPHLERRHKFRPPAMPFPPMPHPIRHQNERLETSQFNTSARIGNSRSFLNHKSSFLSTSSMSSQRRLNLASIDHTQSHRQEESNSLTTPISSNKIKPEHRTQSARMHLQDQIQFHERDNNGLALSNVTFSSAYDKPYFPLNSMRPDTSNVPSLNNIPTVMPDIENNENLAEPAPSGDETIVHSTFVVRLNSGIRVLCTPEALSHLNGLLSGLQPLRPESVLDDLQIGTVSNVVERSLGIPVPKVLQFRITIPQVAIRFKSQTRGYNGAVNSQTYDLNVEGLDLTAKQGFERKAENFVPKSQPSSVHFSLRQLDCAAWANTDSDVNNRTRIEATLFVTTAWLVKGQEISGQVQSKGIEVRSLNRRVEYLAALISETLTLSNSLTTYFRETTTKHAQRLQFLVFFLATYERKVADPPFFTTASYVLRAASSHPRSSDTWKIVSRLRFVLQHLASDEHQSLARRCLKPDLTSPSDAMDQVIKSLRKWRSWDLLDVRSSSLIQEVYRPLSTNTVIPVVSSPPVKLSLSLGSIGLVVDPGPKQIETQIQGLSMSLLVRSIDHRRSAQGQSSTRDSRLEIFCTRTFVHLNWDIFELAGGLLHHFLVESSPGPSSSATSPVKEPRRVLENILVVGAIENVDVSFTSNNLRATSLIQALRTSSSFTQVSQTETLLTAIIDANVVVMDISSNVTPIMTSRLQQPTLQGSLETKQSGDIVLKSWTLGALCNKLDLDVREDILGLLGIIDLVVADEVTYLLSLTTRMQSISGSRTARTAKTIPVKAITKNIFHVAMLLEAYSISTTLLSSLKATMHGEVARSSFKSILGSEKVLTIDFDLKKHLYVFENSVKDSTQEISSLLLPPINGEIILGKKDQSTTVTSFVAVEEISLDASAVHALFSTLSRREISDLRRNISREIALVQSDYRAVIQRTIGRDRVSKEEHLPKHAILYSARATVAGLSITASTGKTSKQAARLVLDLERIHFSVMNESRRTSETLVFPEIVMGVQEIRVVLQRVDGKESQSCGDVTFAVSFNGTSKQNEQGQLARSFEVTTNYLEVNVYPETASMIVDILGYLQQRFTSFNLPAEINTFRARRHRSKSRAKSLGDPDARGIQHDLSTALFTSMYSLEVDGVQVSWKVGDLTPISPGHEVEDLVFSIEKIHLATRKANAARLLMRNLQLQMVPTSQSTKVRSRNSALMPEVIFNVAYLSTLKDRRLAFQAIGKSVDLRLTSQFILPASDLQRSIALATRDLRKVLADWNASFIQDEQQNKKLLGNKKLSSVLIDADFAGAVVYLQGKKSSDPQSMSRTMVQASLFPQSSPLSYSGFEDSAAVTVLRTPGIALKLEYKDLDHDDPALNTEIKIDASSNTLQPTIVPLIMELSSSVKEIVSEHDEPLQSVDQKSSPNKVLEENVLRSADPAAVLGKCRLNLGLRICRQEFGLSCQPMAKVAATAQFDDIYITFNTVQATDQSRFFAISAVVTQLKASVQHDYSRESTGSFKISSIELSLMNSRHVSQVKGISAILKFSPMDVLVNARQLHDFLLFREIWLPVEIRQSKSTSGTSSNENHPFDVQRYQQVAATGAFPWNATVSIEKLDVLLDLGQSLGKLSFTVSKLWVCSKKHSDWEQDLCLGFERVGIDSVGRMSGAVGLHNLRLRTSIRWPDKQQLKYQTPLIQASLSFDDLRAKAAFEYQVFLITDLSPLEFLMHNVRDGEQAGGDRLVCTVNSDKVQAFCTAQSSASAIALYQAVQRLIHEKRLAYENSLTDIEQYYRRKVSSVTSPGATPGKESKDFDSTLNKTPVQLQTNVVVTLKAVNVGVYPKAFSDGTIFKLEALDAGARFSVVVQAQKVQSALGLQLGQIRVALSNVPPHNQSATFEDLSVDEVIKYSVGSRGGTILKVPRVVASMQTRQDPGATQIDYRFKSSFEGKVEVGWNINRINFIRSMLNSHSRALAHRLGKALPQPAVQITGVPQAGGETSDQRPGSEGREKEKITAVVNVPLSKYSYTALEPPIIQTPQLRDMGEATPPLEWIGLHRDRLPNLTHQIIIVPLLEVAKEVEDAYLKILGSA